jgi:hypothetical protein
MRGEQTAWNVERCSRASLTIDHDEDHWSRIPGSMGATAEGAGTDPPEIARATELIRAQFPSARVPKPSNFAFLKITPKVISVLDYSNGFGLTALVEVEAASLNLGAETCYTFHPCQR